MSSLFLKSKKIVFNRFELAGSLADLGTILPLASGMIFVNGLSPAGIFLTAGLLYIFSGLYFGIPMPVQPMKLICAYSIANGYSAGIVSASVFLMGILLIFLGFTGITDILEKITPKAVIRGIQVSAGIMLSVEGVRFVLGRTQFQVIKPEPFLAIQNIGPIPISLFLGIVSFIIVLFLFNNSKIPASLAVITFGVFVGLFLGIRYNLSQIQFFSLPNFLPFSFPSLDLILLSIVSLVIPQTPLSIGNSIISAPDLALKYYDKKAYKVTPKAIALSMGFANIASFMVGGIPLCHGSGGLSAHYRFGSRSAGSNLIIGSIFLVSAIVLGENVSLLINLIPLSVLGVLLTFAGIELALMIKDLNQRSDLFVVFSMVSVTIASNLAPALLIGVFLHYMFKRQKNTK